MAVYSYDEKTSMARQVTHHMSDHKVEWLLDREKNPLKYMRYVSKLFLKFSGICLQGLGHLCEVDKAGHLHSRHHPEAQGELSKCPHLKGHKPPPANMVPPSIVSLGTIKKEYEDAIRSPKMTPAELQALRKRLVCHYRGLRWHKQADELEKATNPPPTKNTPTMPAPMELDADAMNAGGDAPTWAERAEAEEKAKGRQPEVDQEGFTRLQRRNHKRRRSDGSQQGRAAPPFPLDVEKRVDAVLTLCKEAASKSYETCPWILELIQKRYPTGPEGR